MLEILLASGRAARYGGAVGDNAIYKSTAEITDAILEADAEICHDIISTPGHPYRGGFMALSASLANGDLVPAHAGAHGEVRVDPTGSGAFSVSRLARSRDQIQIIREFPTIFSSRLWHFVEDSHLYHAGSAARIYTPQYAKTSACQAHEAYEGPIIFGAVERLEKRDGDPALAAKYGALFLLARRLIRDKTLVVPEQAQLEKLMEAA